MSLVQRLSALTEDRSLGPLAVLTGLNFVDEFDRFAFTTLTPEIRDAFGLSDTGIAAVGLVAGGFILLGALPLGVVADRVRRVRVVVAGAALWGTMSVLTGLVPTVALLFVVRLVAGVGRLTTEIVHPSLLNDYYGQEDLPRIFQVHQLANPTSMAAGLAAGFIATQLSWEWSFFLLAMPTFILLAFATRLREPDRGETVDAGLAAATRHVQVDVGAGLRRLREVGTLRRLWAGSFLLGTVAVSITLFLSLFFEQVYGFGPIGRGFVMFVYGAGVVVGLFAGGRLAERATDAGDAPGLAVVTGASGLWFAGALGLMVTAPWAQLSLAAVFLLALASGAFRPAYYPLVGLVTPPKLRSMSYGVALVFLAIGAFIGIAYVELAAHVGYRLAIGTLAVTGSLAGLVAWSAKPHVAADVAAAEASLRESSLEAERSSASRLVDDVSSADSRENGPAPPAQAVLRCSGVEAAYGRVQVLFGADLEVRAGEIVALLGTNGAGKSTLLKTISGLLDPIGGSIEFAGEDITHAGPARTTRLGIAQVPGGEAIFPGLSVRENLRLGGWLERGDPNAVLDATDRVLHLFPKLRERLGQPAGTLSGGEQQMLGLGMAFVCRPRILLVDELSLGLAPSVVEDLLAVVRRLRDEGLGIVVVEQSVNVALQLAERAYFMEKGETRFEGPTDDLLERDDILRSVFLAGAAGNGDGAGSPARTADAETEQTEQTARAGQPPSRAATTPAVEAGGEDATAEMPVVAPLLDVRGVTKRYGGITAVDDASVVLTDGEILGIIGPNGAGKTTLFDLVSGFVRPDAGSVHLDGTDLTDRSPHERASLGLGRSFQNARLVPSLTVAENLALGLERHLEWRDHLAASFALPEVVALERDVAYTVAELVELMGLGAYRDKFVRELSTGTRRVVDLAMVVAHGPRVLLLDEPSSGIAQREAEALGPLLRRIQDETGCSLLVIEHDMPLITSVADRLVAMDLGRPIAEGSPEEVTSDERVVTSYLGGDPSAIQRSGSVS